MNIDILQVGKFKGAEEPLTRDGPSDEARASLEGVLASLRDVWLTGIRDALEQHPDLDAALSWAARCPGASHGTMEVRPLWTM